MCGISAVISERLINVKALALGMNAVVRHRGPDGAAVRVFSPYRGALAGTNNSDQENGTVALGHVRLAILDLSNNAQQPMPWRDGRYWITFNGEIYNHDAIRAELKLPKSLYRSRSDTEVILAAYERWGIDLLERLNGIFSFVIFDSHAEQIFAARDRFGVKPLYYWIGPDGLLAFASEIKQFTSLPGWRATMNPARAYDFLNFGIFDHTGETLFDGVRQLRGGEYCRVDVGVTPLEPTVRKWYTLHCDTFDGSYDDAVEEFREHFSKAMELQLQSDVPVVASLSGGLDSSSVVAVAKDLSSSALDKTFSVRFEDPEVDEGEFINAVNELVNFVNVQTMPLENRLFSDLESIAWHQDEPFASTSVFAQWTNFEKIKEQGFKVALDGQGADEILAGYPPYFGTYIAGLLGSGRFLKLINEVGSIHKHSNISPTKLLLFLLDARAPLSVRNYLRRLVRLPCDISPSWINPRLRELAGDQCWHLQNYSDLSALSEDQIQRTHLPMLLHYADRNSMAHAVEARVPFLDHSLVEFCLSLPDSYKVGNGRTKRIMRSAHEHILPKSVAGRKDKLGFATPQQKWMYSIHSDKFRSLLADAVDSSQGLITPQAIDDFDKMVAGEQSPTTAPWRQISFGAWARVFSLGMAS